MLTVRKSQMAFAGAPQQRSFCNAAENGDREREGVILSLSKDNAKELVVDDANGVALPIITVRSDGGIMVLLMSVLNGVIHVYRTTLLLFQKDTLRVTLLLAGVWFGMCFGFYGLLMWLPEVDSIPL